MSLSTEQLARCIKTLAISLKMMNDCDVSSVEYEIFRNAVIKGYELTLETSGSLLRKALKPYFASPRNVDKLTFKDVFRHAAKHDIINFDAVERWFAYRDNRNSTAHDYGEGFAEETLQLLPKFINDAEVLQERLNHAES